MFHYSDVRSNSKTKSYTPVRTIYKCFSVLEYIADRQPVRIPEIVRAVGLTRANVHRLVATLERLGYVERREDGKVHLSYKIFKMGSTVPHSRKLDEVTRPFMHQLSELSGETVNLGVLYADSVIYLDKVEAKQHLRLDHQIGEIDPLYCTALGKVLLSGFPDQDLERFFASVELRQYTENTILNKEKLLEEIGEVRRKGYALDLKELDANLHCIATPIYDYRNKLVAAMSISGPSIRFTRKRINLLIAPMLEITAQVSRKMGWAGNNTVEEKKAESRKR